jgi:hypothetical protein
MIPLKFVQVVPYCAHSVPPIVHAGGMPSTVSDEHTGGVPKGLMMHISPSGQPAIAGVPHALMHDMVVPAVPQMLPGSAAHSVPPAVHASGCELVWSTQIIDTPKVWHL